MQSPNQRIDRSLETKMYIQRRHLALSKGSVLLALVTTFFGSDLEAKTAQHDVAIAAGQAASSLQELARQTGIQILYVPQEIDGFHTASVAGHMNGLDALQLMLENSGLALAQVNPSTVAITPADQ